MHGRLPSKTMGLILALGLGGCGGDNGGGAAPPHCRFFDACGGNVVGAWDSTGFCASEPLEQVMGAVLGKAACNTAGRSVTGTLAESVSLNADGTYEDNSTLTMNGQLVLEIPCLNALTNSTITAAELPSLCPQYQTTLAGQAPFTSATCTAGSNACSCNVGTQVDHLAAGTYTVSGSTLTTDQGDSTTFCVQGNQLTTRRTTNALFGDFFSYFRRR